MRNFLILTILIIFILHPLSCNSNPFQKKSTQPQTIETGIGFKEFLVSKQLLLKQHMVKLSKEVKKGNWQQLWWLLGLAFGYGVLHAAGPGHGKTLVASYLMARGGTRRSGILIGAFIAFIHGMSAVLIALGIYWLSVGRINQTFNKASSILQWVGYGSITLIGSFIFIRSFRYMIHNKSHIPLLFHSKKKAAWVVLSFGIVPCPANMIVLLFFLSMNMMGLGIIVTFTISIGMAFTVAAVGGFTLVFREFFLKLASIEDHSHAKWVKYAEMIGGFFVMLFGFILLYTKI